MGISAEPAGRMQWAARRRCARFALCVIIAASPGCKPSGPSELAAGNRPNVLLIVADTTRADELEWVSNNKPGYDSLTFELKRLDVFENGTAIAAGTGTIRGTDADGPYVAQYQSTNVLIKRDGKWRAIASHVSGYRKTG